MLDEIICLSLNALIIKNPHTLMIIYNMQIDFIYPYRWFLGPNCGIYMYIKRSIYGPITKGMKSCPTSEISRDYAERREGGGAPGIAATVVVEHIDAKLNAWYQTLVEEIDSAIARTQKVYEDSNSGCRKHVFKMIMSSDAKMHKVDGI